jgi:hypothetical protein
MIYSAPLNVERELGKAVGLRRPEVFGSTPPEDSLPFSSPEFRQEGWKDFQRGQHALASSGLAEGLGRRSFGNEFMDRKLVSEQSYVPINAYHHGGLPGGGEVGAAGRDWEVLPQGPWNSYDPNDVTYGRNPRSFAATGRVPKQVSDAFYNDILLASVTEYQDKATGKSRFLTSRFPDLATAWFHRGLGRRTVRPGTIFKSNPKGGLVDFYGRLS